ncbi:MAG: hypothetical protein KDE31_21125, partial [Caldilineaceae bacterium]|nr:hypothetical protein [Caldilineaceae bacterium]
MKSTRDPYNHPDNHFVLASGEKHDSPFFAESRNSPPKPSTAFRLPSYLTGLLTALILVGGTTLLFQRREPPPLAFQPMPTLAPTPSPTPTATPSPLVIFVSGAVQRPG